MRSEALLDLMHQPKGLYILFFTELWERFSYYGMRAILVLYLVSDQNSINAGLGFSKSQSIEIYGWYTALVYLACVPGGLIADKFLGQKKSVLIGGYFLCLGHLILSIPNVIFFWLGILLIIFGVGLLKPNISSLVGLLYHKNDKKREQGFTIFYIGINIGAFIASITVGYIGEKFGWHYGFSLAGIGMILGQIVFLKGQKYLDIKHFKKKSNTIIKNKSFTKVEKDRIKVLFISFLLIISFWAAFEQAGGLMNIFVYEKTNRFVSWLGNWQVPASWFQSINPLLIIILGLPVSRFWIKMQKYNISSSSLFKITCGLIIMGLGFIFMFLASIEYQKNGFSSMHWIFLAFLFHTIGELCASPVILSFITKLTPTRFIASTMGIYFAMVGIGNKFAGSIGYYSQTLGESEIFISITFFCIILSLIVLIFIKKLNKLAHNADN